MGYPRILHPYAYCMDSIGMIGKNIKYFLTVAALACQASAWAHSVDQDYKVVGVLDGGTVKIAGENKEFTCRLYGMVAPEINLAVGQSSRESLSELTFGRNVHVHIIHTAGSGILGCRVYVDGKDISREQIKRGMAWNYKGFTVDAQLLHAENDAKARRVGLWSEPGLVQPAQ